MKKVLTERPRNGRGYASVAVSQDSYSKGKFKHDVLTSDDLYDVDFLTSYSTGASRQYGYEHKEFSDLLGPLQRYLHSCVGRYWDEVYSEICQNVDRRSVLGDHLHIHVKQFVCIDTFVGEDGKIYDKKDLQFGWKRHIVQPIENQYNSSGYILYVHPETKILSKFLTKRPSWRRNKKEDKDIVRTNDENLWYEKIDKIWYRMIKTFETGIDVFGAQYSIENINKKQLNKKELQDLGLKNF